jgi:hypothetical protein
MFLKAQGSSLCTNKSGDRSACSRSEEKMWKRTVTYIEKAVAKTATPHGVLHIPVDHVPLKK